MAICCSQEQLHTQEFIKTVISDAVIDCDAVVCPSALPALCEFISVHIDVIIELLLHRFQLMCWIG